ncbi:MAG TPA: hypothetical protein VGQ90_08175 [Stellaceae bacterium]|jgi:hypothetical protein|nr:hypothetical protein [Stellaceae bacterium]
MRTALALSLLLLAAPAFAAAPCTRTDATPAGGIDLDVVRCQVALDAERMGEMQSQLNAAAAALTLLRADLAAAEAQKQTLIEWLKAAQGEARAGVGAATQK